MVSVGSSKKNSHFFSGLTSLNKDLLSSVTCYYSRNCACVNRWGYILL